MMKLLHTTLSPSSAWIIAIIVSESTWETYIQFYLDKSTVISILQSSGSHLTLYIHKILCDNLLSWFLEMQAYVLDFK